MNFEEIIDDIRKGHKFRRMGFIDSYWFRYEKNAPFGCIVDQSGDTIRFFDDFDMHDILDPEWELYNVNKDEEGEE